MNQHAPIEEDKSYNIEAEQAVLGCVLMDNSVLDARLGFLQGEHFGEKIHQDIFDAVRRYADAGRRADAVTLIPDFRAERIDDMTNGAQYIARLVAAAVPIAMVRDYGLAVLEAYAVRLASATCEDFAARFRVRTGSERILDIVGDLEDEIAAIRNLAPKGAERSSINAYVDTFIAELSDADASARATIPFPLPEIASILQEDGFEPGNLYGLLAASGEGKTSLLLQIIRAAAEAGHPVLLMSFDQTGQQVVRQMVSQRTEISLGQMRRKNGLNDREWGIVSKEVEGVRQLPIEVKTLRTEKIGRICGQAQAFAKRWARTTDKPCLIVLDHNRKVAPDRPNDHEGRIAASINGAGKALAEELGAAVLFLNQRNSGGSKRDVPRPIISDLFGGEMAREDYDSILYLYRPEHWQNEKLKVAGSATEEDKIRARFRINGQDPEGKAELGALKVRYGRADVREIVRWNGRFTKYETMRSGGQELF
ncbi:replicative DNA helicase [Aureimonas phyllosphaerae]|uniref:replicative DNA helicase n=1 Tax=Aureimonas phyllosphaerae TaxID=1166078 RepID=UPI003A5C4EC1